MSSCLAGPAGKLEHFDALKQRTAHREQEALWCGGDGLLCELLVFDVPDDHFEAGVELPPIRLLSRDKCVARVIQDTGVAEVGKGGDEQERVIDDRPPNELAAVDDQRACTNRGGACLQAACDLVVQRPAEGAHFGTIADQLPLPRVALKQARRLLFGRPLGRTSPETSPKHQKEHTTSRPFTRYPPVVCRQLNLARKRLVVKP